jgi:hypothetical protein
MALSACVESFHGDQLSVCKRVKRSQCEPCQARIALRLRGLRQPSVKVCLVTLCEIVESSDVPGP